MLLLLMLLVRVLLLLLQLRPGHGRIATPTHVEGEVTLGRLVRGHCRLAGLLLHLHLLLHLLVQLGVHLLLLLVQQVQNRADVLLEATFQVV